MKKHIFLALILFVFVSKSKAQSDSTTKANEIMKLEQMLTDALPADSNTWNKYLDPHWYITTEDGSGMTRKEFIESFAPFPKDISGVVKVTAPVFAFHDNIAVIHYVADEHEQAYGQNLHTTYATVDTWYKSDKGWMMLSMLSFEIPALPPPIKVDSQILQQYTGIYQLTDSIKAVISLKNDTLFIQKGKHKPEALVPETSSVFFRKSDTRGRKLFVKNNHGEMLLLERRNGQDLTWKRITAHS